MRARWTYVMLVAVSLALPFKAVWAENLINLGGRYHAEHRHFDKLPFGNGDISYLLGYTYSQSIAQWQLAVDFAPDISGKMENSDTDIITDIDYVITPQLNLLFQDRFYRGGTGIRTSYIKSEDDSEWLDPYWQLLLGINLPLPGRFSLDASATYVFEKWEYLDRFDFRDLEYNLVLNVSF